jgi:hypothetical protein
MEVIIGEVVSNVRTVDSNSLLAPRTMQQIVTAVLEALRRRDEHDKRVREEQQITPGVRAEIEGRP